jgi:membrane protein DedA with SNARE-associated domain
VDGINLGFTFIPFEDIGYLAVFAIMILDGANVPFTPNELFLGFAGYLARTGDMNAVLAYLMALMGSLVGHLLSFFVGWKVGRPLFDRYGKFIFVTPKNIQAAERALKRFGNAAPFIVRFIPGLRNIGSLFFGAFRIPTGPFILLTTAGIAIYNALFFLTGYILAERFADLKDLLFPLVIGVLAVGLSLAAISWYRMRRPTRAPSSKIRPRRTRRAKRTPRRRTSS